MSRYLYSNVWKGMIRVLLPIRRFPSHPPRRDHRRTNYSRILLYTTWTENYKDVPPRRRKKNYFGYLLDRLRSQRDGVAE